MLKAIIIDDEKNSRNALRQKLVNHCPEVTVIGECDNGEEGIKMIGISHPDIVFLDVEMPRMNGFTMLQQLPHYDFEIIFITAYDQYAIKAIKFSALDYLLKPVEVEDLKFAVEKVTKKRKQVEGNKRVELLLQNFLEEKSANKRIAIASMDGLLFIATDDIIYLEANGNYTIFHIAGNRKITATKTLKDFEELLPASLFIRIHHSYLINKHGIEKYIKGEGGHVVMKNGVTLDVARRKKEEFMKAIG